MTYDGFHPSTITFETFMIRFAGALGIRSDNKSQFCSRKDTVMWTAVTSSRTSGNEVYHHYSQFPSLNIYPTLRFAQQRR